MSRIKNLLTSLRMGNKPQSYIHYIKMYNYNHKFNHNCKFLRKYLLAIESFFPFSLRDLKRRLRHNNIGRRIRHDPENFIADAIMVRNLMRICKVFAALPCQKVKVESAKYLFQIQ